MREMKLSLVVPYFEGFEGYTTSSPPLSLGFIGTYVRDLSDCEVEIIDPMPQGLSEKSVLKKVKESDLVGLTCITDTRFQCFDFAKKVKQANPNCTLIVGGPHVNTLDKLIIEHYPFIDVIVRGEGEETILDLVKNKPYKEILGITWKNNGKIIQNPDRPFIQDIDSLYCDYSLFPDIDKYPKDLEASKELKGLKTIYIIASRGCPFKCSYYASRYWKRKWRGYSPEELVRRMEHLHAEYDIEYFRFFDFLFTANKKRVLRFCELLKKSKLDVVFSVEARVGADKEVFVTLNKVGCKHISFGIESGSDRILKRIDKNITRTEIDKTIVICKELDWWMAGFFMVSLPDETIDDFEETLKLTKYFDINSCTIMELFPDTPFYDELKQKGEINDEIWFDKKYDYGPIGGLSSMHYCKDLFSSANFSMRELRWLSQSSYYYHHLHCPKKVLERYGLPKGILALIKAGVDMPLKGRIDRVYRKLSGSADSFEELMYRMEKK